MDTEKSEDWYSELENNVNKLFQAKKINLGCFNQPEIWDKFSKKLISPFEEGTPPNWTDFLDGVISHIGRGGLGFEAFDGDYFKKQVERLLRMLTNIDRLSRTDNRYEVDLIFQKNSPQKCNLCWLLILIAYLLKEKGHQDNFHDFACSFNELVKELEMEFRIQGEGELQDIHSSQRLDKGDKEEKKQIKPKKNISDYWSSKKNIDEVPEETKSAPPKNVYQGAEILADMLILVLAKKYLPELQEIGQKSHLVMCTK